MALEKFGTGESLLDTAVETDDESQQLPFYDKEIPASLIEESKQDFLPINVDADSNPDDFVRLASIWRGGRFFDVDWSSIKGKTADEFDTKLGGKKVNVTDLLKDTEEPTKEVVDETEDVLKRSEVVDKTGDKYDQFQEALEETPEVKKGLLTDIRLIGKKGDPKLPQEETLIKALEATSKTYEKEITNQKRGKVADTAVRELADTLGMSKEKLVRTVLERKKGAIFNIPGSDVAASTLAARDLLNDEMEHAYNLAMKARLGSDEDVLQFMIQMDFVGDFMSQLVGQQAELGRAVRSYQMVSRKKTDPDLYFKDLTDALEQFGGSDRARRIAESYTKLGTKQQRANFHRSSKLSKFFNAFYEYWINAILSSPVSHMKNIVGAKLTTFAHIPETFVAAGVRKYRTEVYGEGAGVEFGEASAMVFGAYHSLYDAMRFAGHTLKTGERPIAGSKIEVETPAQLRDSKAFSAKAFNIKNSYIASAVDGLGRVATMDRLPTRMLEFEDTFFKVIGQRMVYYQEAYRSGVQKGLRGDELTTHIVDFINDPPTEILQKADDHAAYVTLQTKLDTAGKSIQGIRQIPMIRYFIPFFRTPYNAFKYAFLERTPIGMFFSGYKDTIAAARAKDATVAQRAAADMAQARMIMGSGLTMISAGLALQGKLTGSGPADPDRRRVLKNMGWRPYSVKIGDTYVSYAGTEPFASVLGIAADLGEVGLYMKESSDGNTWEKLILGVAAALSYQATNKTFMQGFSNLIALIDEPARKGEFTLQALFASTVPRIAASIEKEFDPLYRDAQTMVDKARGDIPFLSEGLPPSRNFWGQQTGSDTSPMGVGIINPFYAAHEGPNPFAEDQAMAKRAYEIDKVFAETQWGTPKHGDEFIYPGTDGQVAVRLTKEEKDIYHKILGELLVNSFENFLDSNSYKDLRKVYDGGLDENKILGITYSGSKLKQYNPFDPEKRAEGTRKRDAAKDAQMRLHKEFSAIVGDMRKVARSKLINDPKVGSDLRKRLDTQLQGYEETLEEARKLQNVRMN